MRTIECPKPPEQKSYEADTIYRVLSKDDPIFYRERTDRNEGFIALSDQQMIRKKVIGVAGCGGMGGLLSETLVRLGIGEIHLADLELFDISNINRQLCSTSLSIGKPKLPETAERLNIVSPDVCLELYHEGITKNNASYFLRNCLFGLDEMEFWALGSKIAFHEAARKLGITVFTVPVVGHGFYIFKFTPGGMTIEEVLGMDYEEAMMLQIKMQTRTATLKEVRRAMNAMLRLVTPEGIPEYCKDTTKRSTTQRVLERLEMYNTASIIATTPPMASGALSSVLLFHIMQESEFEMNYVLTPEMPGYQMFDAARWIAKTHVGKWW